MAAPPGSVTTAMTPRSATAIGGTITPPPCSVAVATVFSASGVERYTDQPSGASIPGCLGIRPPTRTPSLVRLVYPPNSGADSSAAQPNSSP